VFGRSATHSVTSTEVVANVGRADRSVEGLAQNLDYGKLRLTLFGEFGGG
jgi:hypothetical protein